MGGKKQYSIRTVVLGRKFKKKKKRIQESSVPALTQ